MPDTEIKLNPLTIARHLKDKKMKITIRASLRICPILHWHVKIYASTPENLTPLIISRKLSKVLQFFTLFLNSNSTNMKVVILLALFLLI